MSATSVTSNKDLFARAQKHIPGGVNSPARAFKAVGGEPRFIVSAKGSKLFDQDGKSYIDMFGSWGPMILGHQHPMVTAAIERQAKIGVSYGAPTELEIEMAELVCEIVPSLEMVRMVNSGTEATMSAIRVARAATKRDLIIKFEGCYHGHGDSFLSKAGSGLATLGEPTSPGVPKGAASATLNAKFNDLESVKQLFSNHPDEIAGVIVEPVVGNMGCVPPNEGFLQGLKDLCESNGAILIFDEVMTGFRLSLGGAQELYGVTPHLTTLGKVIGGGLPVGAYGGKKELMENVAPVGPMYQAGTLSGNPLAMAAGLAQLRYLKEHKSVYTKLEKDGARIEEIVTEHMNKKSYPVSFNRVGSMGTVFFNPDKVMSWDESSACKTDRFAKFFWFMMENGVHLPCAQFEAWFHSYVHTDEEVEKVADLMCQGLDKVF